VLVGPENTAQTLGTYDMYGYKVIVYSIRYVTSWLTLGTSIEPHPRPILSFASYTLLFAYSIQVSLREIISTSNYKVLCCIYSIRYMSHKLKIDGVVTNLKSCSLSEL
jgi:hypothetical protein